MEVSTEGAVFSGPPMQPTTDNDGHGRWGQDTISEGTSSMEGEDASMARIHADME